MSRKDTQFKKGQSGNPGGKPKGTVDRVNAILLAIQKKAKLDGEAGVVKWLASLPDRDLAMLYGRLLPKDIKLQADVTVTWEKWLEQVGRPVPRDRGGGNGDSKG